MIRCFDILIGCNSALIHIRLHPDPAKIRIRPEPKSLDPVKIHIQPDLTVMNPVGFRSGWILKYGIQCNPTQWRQCSVESARSPWLALSIL